MPPRYKTRVPHVHIHLAPARIPPYYDLLLAYQVFEVASVEPRDRDGCRLLRPLHLGGRGGRRLEREQRPGVALGAARDLCLSHVGRVPHISPTRRPGPDVRNPLRLLTTDGTTHMRKPSTRTVNNNYINRNRTTT